MLVILRTPLRSALAVWLFIELNLGDSVPETVREQGQWWANTYHSGENAATFESEVTEYEGGKS